MSQEKKIFLGKSGKIFGPYTQEEFDQMSVDGVLHQFVWMWSDSENKWCPIELPPPPVLPVQTPLRPSVQVSAKISAICFDLSHLLYGELECMTQTGCTFVAPAHLGLLPVFSKNRTSLSLLNEASNESVTLPVYLIHQVVRDGQCRYLLRWDELPPLFALS